MYRQNEDGSNQFGDFFGMVQQQSPSQGSPFGQWPGQGSFQGPGEGPPFGQGPGQGEGPPFGQGSGQTQMPPYLPGQAGGLPGQFGPGSQGQFGGGPSVQAVDPGSFQGCLRRLTDVRLTNRRRFWFYPTYIGRRSVAGYRWFPRRNQWAYTGFDTNSIESFQCY
ncbi:hypothetical protein SAMN05421676_102257 [Salinibacillus kushneri]|uniref:Transporter n=1 Tax=Salinibacillus kushneri TaxID=237682 RepID=A0A1I0AVK3_9BACI|nr:hypothetical protein [Salinibacillus kushneri]SES97807.1 hypothetical protein SAMN05421676_102257 [Salinibacillus kushneri]